MKSLRMPKWPKQVWGQLKALTPKEICDALERDGWIRDIEEKGRSPIRHYVHSAYPDREVTIHFHPNKGGYQPGLLKHILDKTGWDVNDLRRLGLIRGKQGKKK